jgi:N-acetyltransferase 10
MLRELDCATIPDAPTTGWMSAFVRDYRTRLISLMAYTFNKLEAALAITLIDPERRLTATNEQNAPASSAVDKPVRTYEALPLTALELLTVHLSYHDMKRLELYSRNMVDHHMILDTLPTLARLLFQGRLTTLRLSYLQVAILLATGLQHRDVDSIAHELDLPSNQVLAFFNKTIRKITAYLKELIESHTAKDHLPSNEEAILRMERRVQTMGYSLAETLEDDQNADEGSFCAQAAARADHVHQGQQRARIVVVMRGNKEHKHHIEPDSENNTVIVRRFCVITFISRPNDSRNSALAEMQRIAPGTVQ